MSGARADIEGPGLAERLLSDAVAGHGVARPCGADMVAYRFLWGHYMVTGDRRSGDAVLHSLRAICRSAHMTARLSDIAWHLELLTWVWRVERCPDLRRRAEDMAAFVVTRMRAPGCGFAARVGDAERDRSVPPGANGLMLVALIEAGSVFERRDWLALAREAFDELVAGRADDGALRHVVEGGRRGAAADLEDHAMMSRAAMRLFEAFGKPRYLQHAEAWAAPLDATVQDAAGGGDRAIDARRATPQDDAGLASMIGVLARLHALTGKPGYAERAEALVETPHPLVEPSGLAGAIAIAAARTAARLLSIEISGDPKLPETRALMRIALDCGLPDRLVLGPGAGRVPGEQPLAHIRVGPHRLAPIGDAARLQTLLEPGGLAAVFHHRDTRVTVDSRSRHWIT